jgi:hypothetical protein
MRSKTVHIRGVDHGKTLCGRVAETTLDNDVNSLDKVMRTGIYRLQCKACKRVANTPQQRLLFGRASRTLTTAK